jgi:exopolysaccharide biosynthesis polyprenyl glycosylphosphotransferase
VDRDWPGAEPAWAAELVRPRLSVDAAARISLSASEAVGLLAVLAVTRRLTPGWALWSLGLVLALTGLDRCTTARIAPRLIDSIPPVAAWVGALSLVALPFMAGSASTDLPAMAVAVLAALLVVRALAGVMLRCVRRQGRLHHRVLVVGSGEIALRLVCAMQDHPELGMRPVGLVDDEPGLATARLPRLGPLGELEALVRRQRVSRIVLAFSLTHEARIVRLLRACEGLSVEVYVVPRFFELGFDASAVDDLWGIPLARLPRSLSRRSARAIKRGSDIVVSLSALVALSPLMLIAAVMIRIADGGPVMFRQTRVGLNGRPFVVLKFRTVRPNDDGDSTWSVVDDPRISSLGGFLRRTGFDEAPQLLNVLRGDMSLVGPRPERPAFADGFARSIPEYEARHRVRAGITGWAQVNGLRGDTSIVDRARFDNYYVATWTLGGDLMILLRTVTLLLRQALPTGARVLLDGAPRELVTTSGPPATARAAAQTVQAVPGAVTALPPPLK